MTKTLVNGKWIADPIKDYSNGKTSVANTRENAERNASVLSNANLALEAELAKVQAQLAHMHTLVKAIDQCTKVADAKQHIRVARASYPR